MKHNHDEFAFCPPSCAAVRLQELQREWDRQTREWEESGNRAAAERAHEAQRTGRL